MNSFRNYILKDVLDEIKNNLSLPIIVFKLADSYEECIDFIKELMSDNYANGIYRLTKSGNCLREEIAASKLILFYCCKEKLIFGWGLLDDYDKVKNIFPNIKSYSETNPLKGPFMIDNSVRERMPIYYPNGKPTGDMFDHMFYKFKKVELLKVPFSLTTEINENNYMALIVNDNNYDVLESKYKKPSQISFSKVYVKNYVNFERLILKEVVNACELNIPSKTNSLIEQIDSYNIENVHTAFLKNYLKENNIYGLSNEPINNLIKLFISKKNNYYKNDDYNNDDILKDKYYVKSQERLIDESGKKIQPDMVLEGYRYRFIIEIKYYSLENDNQTLKYYDYFERKEDDIHKNIYVYLYLSKKNELSVEKDTNEIYIKVSFKELLDKVYLKHLDSLRNREILTDYLKSFMLTVNPYYRVDIDDVPCFNLETRDMGLRRAKSLYNELRRYGIPENKGIAFDNLNQLITVRYLLVILYNDEIDEDIKIKIKEIYNSLKYNGQS